jgi:hypothetical protein
MRAAVAATARRWRCAPSAHTNGLRIIIIMFCRLLASDDA